MNNRKPQLSAISRLPFAVSRLNNVHCLYKESAYKRQDQGQIFPMRNNSKKKRSCRCKKQDPVQKF
jgi:hypothetical protein